MCAEFSYNRSNFWDEYFHLGDMPRNSKEVRNKLTCLWQLSMYFDPKQWESPNYSKRRNRLTKMYFIFRKREREAREAKKKIFKF